MTRASGSCDLGQPVRVILITLAGEAEAEVLSFTFRIGRWCLVDRGLLAAILGAATEKDGSRRRKKKKGIVGDNAVLSQL